MAITSGKLVEGDWVHLFPEGRVSFSGKMLPCRKGVGKLVCDYINETGRYSAARCMDCILM
jgi:monolysocardiolipin acyltransferase